MTNTYDALGRVQKKTIGLNTPYETTITYVDVGTSKTSGLIASYQNGNDDPYLYTYDDNGNILSITHGSISITYAYDSANRLIRENNTRCQGDGSLDNFCNTHKTVKYIILPMDFGCSAGVSISRSPNGATFFVFAEP